MSKITLFIAFVCLCVVVQAQSDREICRRINERCLSRAERNGRNNEVSDIFNENCRRNDRNWRSISRCELARATCILTLERCDTLSCDNVRRALERRPTE
ncbi:uncharacterized protein Eig71Eb [Drosophila takahashii]|uniref:uncharacterized protein Eig71Eb n=1 Tax=Drosophila takahashii TaxID=29030 RepID=UPI0007E8AB8C|nr:uncharacterized protein LOC108057885 [Drosophila takahashii]